jgi:hypothetical protein
MHEKRKQPFQCSNIFFRNLSNSDHPITFVFLNKDQPIVLNSSSDNQSIYRRSLTERRDHENPLLFNYDNLNQYTKYGTSSLL